MSAESPRLMVQSSPFIRAGASTPRIMLDVVLALLLVTAASVWVFGVSALLVVAASSLGAVGAEWVFGQGRALRDYSAILTGIILGLTLPPGFPLWMAFLGGLVAIGLGKRIWGGLGHNLFNPALVGRAFLQAAFPTVITTWSPPGDLLTVRAGNLARPFMHAPDAITTASPLNLMKFEQQVTPWTDMMLGKVAGSLGETSAIVIVLCGIFLAARRTFDWRIPVSILVSVSVFSGILFLIGPDRFPTPHFMLLSGGLLFGAVFMATDPVTTPIAPRGAVIFGVGVGVLVVLIRVWGGLPEGVMYAILLMNAATPLIERYSQPRAFGHLRRS